MIEFVAKYSPSKRKDKKNEKKKNEYQISIWQNMQSENKAENLWDTYVN